LVVLGAPTFDATNTRSQVHQLQHTSQHFFGEILDQVRGKLMRLRSHALNLKVQLQLVQGNS